MKRPQMFGVCIALIVAGFLFGLLPMVHAISFDPGDAGTNSSPAYTPLDSWWFNDHTNWTSDTGCAPVSFTNIAFSPLGNFASVLVDSTNAAWLQYNVIENDGTTNLTVDTGTVMFWFAPGSWSSVSEGGTGPGEWGRLFEVGSYTTNSGAGWWSIYVDDVGENLYFSTQTNDLSGNYSNYIATPIAWTTNYFHFIALTYSATNTALYLDGDLATNGPPLTVYPGPDVLTNGFFIGSDSSGVYQAHGLFNSVATYDLPLDAGTIQQIFNQNYFYYMMNPWNTAMSIMASANSSTSGLSQPSSSPNYFNVISGAGYLQYLGDSGNCVTSSDAWLTNVSATAASQPMTFNFSIAGGASGGLYDVFAAPALASPLAGGIWTWLGQGGTCGSYSIPGLPVSGAVFFILGTPLDGDGDGLTDAYEWLVSHSNPNVPDTDGNGMPDGWQVLHFSGIGNNPNSDPDQDGLTNLKEYLYGSDPQVSEGVAVWTAGGYSSIP